MWQLQLRTFLDFYARTNSDIIIICEGEENKKCNKIKLLSDNSPLLDKSVREFDIINGELVVYLKK